MKIGDLVRWTTQNYWGTKHPDESGYETAHHSGRVISFDETTVVVIEGGRVYFLDVKDTAWSK